MKKTKLLFIFLLVASSCSPKHKGFSREDLVRIYTSHELLSEKEAQEIVKEYNLYNESKRALYYKSINELAIDEEVFNKFLDDVENYHKSLMANKATKDLKEKK